MNEESLTPERDALWAKHVGLSPSLAAGMCALAGKLEIERNEAREVIRAATVLIAAKGRHNTMLAYHGLCAALSPENV